MQTTFLLSKTNLCFFSSYIADITNAYITDITNTCILLPFVLDLSGLILACFVIAFIAGLICEMGKYDNACTRCAAKGIKVYVLPGKHCPRCNQPC